MINIQKDISLSGLTTFRIGGPAKYFTEAFSIDEIKESIEYAKKNNLDLLVIGGGSNLLVSDEGFDGLVVKIKLDEISVEERIIKAGSGVALARVVNESVKNSLAGIEWAFGIPGTIGGAVRGNAGAFGGSTGDIIKKVEALNIENREIKEYNQVECKFGYRDSFFKNNPGLIIISATFGFSEGNEEESRRMMKEIIEKRVSKQPKGLGSAGSFFKNPVVKNEKLRKDFEDEKGIRCKDDKLPAGWLIDRVGLTGKKIGGAMVSEDHSNYIVNTGDASAGDVLALVSLIKQQVRDEFGVQLQEEVQYVGF